MTDLYSIEIEVVIEAPDLLVAQIESRRLVSAVMERHDPRFDQAVYSNFGRLMIRDRTDRRREV